MEYSNKRPLDKWVAKIGDGFKILSIMCSFRILTEGGSHRPNDCKSVIIRKL